MITKKQESKFLNVVVSLVTVVGLTAPLLIAAGVKATFAVGTSCSAW